MLNPIILGNTDDFIPRTQDHLMENIYEWGFGIAVIF